VDSSPIESPQMCEVGHAGDGSGGAARCEHPDYTATDCTLAQVQQTGRDLGEEVDERVRTYSDDRGDSEAEDENRQKENTAAKAGHPDQGAHDETDSDFDCEQSDHNCDPDSGPGG